jgi:gas vesicle protein
MGQSTEELKRDIEHTRADMSGTLDAIEDRVSPSRMIQRRKNRVAESVHTLRDRVMGTASDMEHGVAAAAGDVTDTIKDAPHAVARRTEGAPMVAGAITFGLGFLVAVAFPATDAEREASTKIADKLEPAKQELMDSAKEVAENLKEPAKQAAQEVKDAASESANAVSSTAREGLEDTKQQASESVSAVQGGPTLPAPSRGVQPTVAAGGHQVGPNEVEGPNSF